MFPDPSDSISKKKNHPIDAIVVCQAIATEHRRNDLGARCGLRLPPGNMMNHRTPLNVPALFPGSVFGFGAVRHRRRRPYDGHTPITRHSHSADPLMDWE
ncbi:hypothetical protein CTAM01_10036 [Colletotrichum tamarilloi]|uniref:Uncharacterized protein n=1 Tax=Colletotrichum tamarilloi TaxID=1209934 RepID=A0ABQ9R1V3_9PEZI|nr:uncharacterized protein CTAM01_10036 [Colletotrichum tamarilloi]KAK1492242.1 hypothetical protein CTAM01_10036 [Colletotrichum tamarilloi]